MRILTSSGRLGARSAAKPGDGRVVAVDVLRAEIDGRAASAGELQFPALVNYGHFTGMQVRERAVDRSQLHGI